MQQEIDPKCGNCPNAGGAWSNDKIEALDAYMEEHGLVDENCQFDDCGDCSICKTDEQLMYFYENYKEQFICNDCGAVLALSKNPSVKENK